MGSQKRKVQLLDTLGLRQKFIDAYSTASNLEDVAAQFPQLFIQNTKNRRNAVAQVAKELGITRPEPLRYPSLPEVTKVTDEELPDDAIVQQVAVDRKLQTLTAERNHLNRLYREATRDAAKFEQLLNTLRDAVSAFPPVTIKSPKQTKADGRAHTAVLHLSDWHIGETVTAEETGGLGGYDMDIVSRRLGLIAQKTIELVDLRRNSVNIPKLKVFLGGDMVSGNIHDELTETNAANVVQQASEGAYMIAQVIATIAPAFDDVEIVCVGGNHGRMHKKPRAKEKELSFDYILYQIVGFLLAKQPNITMRISKSFYELVDIEGYKMLLMHGDSIRGSMGIPWYGVERASARIRQLLDVVKERFDIMLIGHFHTPVMGDYWVANGSGKGIDGYSAGMLHLGNKASQNLLTIHPGYGVVAFEKIYLEGADKNPTLAMKRTLPNVWAEVL